MGSPGITGWITEPRGVVFPQLLPGIGEHVAQQVHHLLAPWLLGIAVVHEPVIYGIPILIRKFMCVYIYIYCYKYIYICIVLMIC